MAKFNKRKQRCTRLAEKRQALHDCTQRERQEATDRMNQAGVKKESLALGDGWRSGRTVKVKAKATRTTYAADVQR